MLLVHRTDDKLIKKVDVSSLQYSRSFQCKQGLLCDSSSVTMTSLLKSSSSGHRFLSVSTRRVTECFALQSHTLTSRH